MNRILLTFIAILTTSLQAEETPNYTIKPVTIWSDGTRMAGDLYLPNDLKPDEKRATILFCAGTGGVKKGNGGLYGRRFAKEGFIVLAFDYRGWGQSDCKLMMTEPMPNPDEKGEITVKAKPIRWQMDIADQTHDIRCAISFLSGEKSVDPARIGLFGTSYGGGLVVWVAGHDPRVKCIVSQVPGMGGGKPPAAVKHANNLAIQQARGETQPVPIDTGKLGGKMTAYAQMRTNPAKGIGYSPVEAAASVKCPTLFTVAEKEDLMSNEANGKAAFELMQKAGTTCEYHELPGLGHYGVYQGACFEEITGELLLSGQDLDANGGLMPGSKDQLSVSDTRYDYVGIAGISSARPGRTRRSCRAKGVCPDQGTAVLRLPWLIERCGAR